MGSPDRDVSLEKLPNIGQKLAEFLREVGISTGAELSKVGSVEAALRLARQRPQDSPCRSMLCALEGAVRSVRWHLIPKAERDLLWSELETCRTNRDK